MTGEMSWIKPNGDDSNGESYPLQARLARALRCRLRPFDRYCGPYIDHELGWLWLHMDDGTATVCLWPGGEAPAYRHPLTADYSPPDGYLAALTACRRVLEQARREEQ